MRLRIEARLDYSLAARADILLQLEAAPMADQRVVEDRLSLGRDAPLTAIAAEEGIGRRRWTQGEGRFTADYEALVEVERSAPDWARLRKVPLGDLPGEAVKYLWPSRYCLPERFSDFAWREFGRLSGGPQAAAAARWIGENIEYRPGCSDSSTAAHDSFEEKRGICRDFAHVMIAMMRALDVPARMVSAYAFKLQPPDFHALVEVYLADEDGRGGWHPIDPTGLAPVEGLVRIGVGRDAADVSFMTIFGGSATLNSQKVSVQSAD